MLDFDTKIWYYICMNQLLLFAPLTILIAAIPAAIYALLHAFAEKSLPHVSRTALVAAFSAYIFFVLSATLLFRNTAFFSIELNPIASYRRAVNAPAHLAVIEIRNIILNIAMFVPLGIFLPLLTKKIQKTYLVLAVAFFASTAIEITQIATRRGVFSIEDILHNTLGAAFGFGLYSALMKIFKKS